MACAADHIPGVLSLCSSVAKRQRILGRDDPRATFAGVADCSCPLKGSGSERSSVLREWAHVPTGDSTVCTESGAGEKKKNAAETAEDYMPKTAEDACTMSESVLQTMNGNYARIACRQRTREACNGQPPQ